MSFKEIEEKLKKYIETRNYPKQIKAFEGDLMSLNRSLGEDMLNNEYHSRQAEYFGKQIEKWKKEIQDLSLKIENYKNEFKKYNQDYENILKESNTNPELSKYLKEYLKDFTITEYFRNLKEKNIDVFDDFIKNGIDINTVDEYGRTILYYAVIIGRIDFLRKLLGYGININLQDKDGNSVLHYAIYMNKNDFIKKLFNEGINPNPNLPENYGTTPLLYSLIEGRLEIFKLLASKGARSDILDSNGKSVLTIIMSNLLKKVRENFNIYYIDLLKMLNRVEIRKVINNPIKRTSTYIEYPICLLLEKNRIDDAKLFIEEYGAEINIPITDINLQFKSVLESLVIGFYEIYKTAYREDIEEIRSKFRLNLKYLFDRKLNYKMNTTKMIYKLNLGQRGIDDLYDIVDYFYQKYQKDPQIQISKINKDIAEKERSQLNYLKGFTNKNSYFIWYIEKDDTKNYEYYITKKGFSRDAVFEKYNYGTALHVAIQKKNIKFIEYLIKLGIDMNPKDQFGKTPLIYCDDSVEILELLVKNGADINSIDNSGRTLLHYIVLKTIPLTIDNLKNVKDLIFKDIKDDFGKTPLMYVNYNEIEVLKKLILFGAKYDIKDEDNVPIYANMPYEIRKFIIEMEKEKQKQNLNIKETMLGQFINLNIITL